MLLRRSPILAVLALLACSGGVAFAFVPSPQSASLEFPLAVTRVTAKDPVVPLAAAFPLRSSPLDAKWTAHLNERTGFARMAYGGGIALGRRSIAGDASAIAAAREVLDVAGGFLGVTSGNAEVLTVRTMPGKWAVHFQQTVGGLPVHTGRAFVLLSGDGDLIAFGSDFATVAGDLSTTPRLSSAGALSAAAAALGASPRTDRPQSADALFVPVPDGAGVALRLAYRVQFEADSPFGKWESFVDAATGEILARRNFFHTVNVTGLSQGDVEDFGYCDGVATKPFENMRVNVTGGNNAVTNDAGSFDISHGGTTPVTVTAQFNGPYCNVNRAGGLGADASFSGSVTPGTPLTINWVGAAQRQDERDTFFHTNRAHDFMKAIDAGFNGLDYAMGAAVGRTDGFCPGNAWWDGSGINFCEAGSGSANTGRIGNVIYHEYGHGVTDKVYGANDPASDLHEGNSDVLANLIDRQPKIGLGFTQGNCGNGIRNSDNDLQFPADLIGEGHHDGQIIAGFHWDAWQEMLANLPQAEADATVRDTWHAAREMGLPQSQSTQVLWTFMVDDDDANLNNGTPHYDFFCAGASNHNFDCPTVTEGVFITHTPISGTFDDGSAGFDVDATIFSTEAALNGAALLVHYRVNGGTYGSVTMAPTGNPDEYRGHIPALNGNSEVDYYISAADLAANTKKLPANAPSVAFSFDVVHIYDTLEAGSAGWTIGAAGDNAIAGIWEYCDPIGTMNSAWIVQPEDDVSPAPGVNCFITAQCAGPACAICTANCSDVDGGVTTLISPVWDLSGATSVRVKYARWFSNNSGAGPNADLWTVDVSNNGGTSWTNVESTTSTITSGDPAIHSAEWLDNLVDINALFGTPGQVRLRFRARDTGTGSIVEAGVDDVRIFAEFGTTGIEDLAPATAPLAFSLGQNQPNPFSPHTKIDFAIPGKSQVELAVYDVGGRLVRTLVEGMRDPGRYAVQWDGRDGGGRRVAAGVYFYRLTTGAETLTRKMTVLK